MSRLLPTIRSTVRQFIRDEFEATEDQDFQDDEIDMHIGDAVAEISERSPRMVKEVLTTIVNSRVLDISSIEELLEIEHLEYPIGYDPRKLRNLNYLDSETIEIDTTLTPSAGGSSTLTGTVTFTTGSGAVTGSGTAFLTELDASYLIRPGSGTRWYRVYSVTSDTALTLDEPVRSADTGADTEDLTEYCYEAVYLYCRKVHQLTDELSTLTPRLERVLIDGAVAKVALSWISQVRVQVREASAKIAGIDTAIGQMSARITQAVSDLTTGRPIIAETRATADAAIDKMTERITQALTDLATGRPTIGKVNVGGQPQRDYVSMAASELGSAATFLNQARGYLSVDTPAGQYGNYAARELSNANGYLNQAGGHVRELSARLSIAGVINSYQSWANGKLALYRLELTRLAKARMYKEYSKG